MPALRLKITELKLLRLRTRRTLRVAAGEEIVDEVGGVVGDVVGGMLRIVPKERLAGNIGSLDR